MMEDLIYYKDLHDSIREIEARHEHTGLETGGEDLDGARLGTEGADDLSHCWEEIGL